MPDICSDQYKWRILLAFAGLIVMSLALTTASGGPQSEIPDRAEYVHPLLPGLPAPAFQARNADGSVFQFDPSRLETSTIIIFYRGGWCPYCNKYLDRMRHAEAELQKMGFDILFLSADRYEKLAGSLDEHDLAYTVLSDSKLEVAQQFGVAFHVHDELFERYLGWGHDLEEASGETHHLLPVPSVFIVNTDGFITFQYVNPNYKVRLDADVLLAAARATLNLD